MNKKPYLKIGKKKIGLEYRPAIIAEIGINHGGSLKLAKKMALTAIRSGADIIKHQTHIVEDEMSLEAKKIIPDNANKSIYSIIEECSLSEREEIELKNFVEKNNAIFLSTPFSRQAAYRLKKMNVSAYKIGSGECNHLPLIELIASFRKPMIVSTGMNDIKNIKNTVKILEKYKIQYALLHCTNVYPTPPEIVRLNCIIEMRKKFKNAVIGYSDHTVNNNACISALGLGASIIERHFTDTKIRKGPDIINSMNPKELSNLINAASEIFLMRSDSKKGIVREEKSVSKFAFATIVAIKDIKKGQKLSLNNIWAKRPGTGKIEAEKMNFIIGATAIKNINKDKHLDYSDIKI